jgi:plastocyanin
METQSGQDRFYPDFIIVNQWDTIHLTFINNDTVMHNFVIGPPYNIMVNASVPGLRNDLTQEVVTQPALGNSPGVVVTGTPGNVSATYTFVAKYAGIFEYVCSYHVQLGMLGYLVVLGSGSTVTQPASSNETAPSGITAVKAVIDPGSGTNVNDPGYTPDTMTVILGINNTVEWRNNDSMAHTVSAVDGSFDSGNMQPGAIFTHTFTQPGTYNYVCVYHHWMHGSVTVLTSGNSTTQESESQTSDGGSTVTLTMYQVYGIGAIGIVVLVALMIFWSRKSHSDQK